jgi:hypothetical protein
MAIPFGRLFLAALLSHLLALRGVHSCSLEHLDGVAVRILEHGEPHTWYEFGWSLLDAGSAGKRACDHTVEVFDLQDYVPQTLDRGDGLERPRRLRSFGRHHHLQYRTWPLQAVDRGMGRLDRRKHFQLKHLREEVDESPIGFDETDINSKYGHTSDTIEDCAGVLPAFTYLQPTGEVSPGLESDKLECSWSPT